MHKYLVSIFLLITGFAPGVVLSDNKPTYLRLAVASNFTLPANMITQEFEAATSTKVSISSASSGKLYAQIKQGAPFDLLLSADALRPNLLVEEGYALSASNRIYAQGKLVFWAPKIEAEDASCKQLLSSGILKHVAMANPDIAPYGIAAKQTMDNLSLVKPTFTLLMGENIGQTFAFIYAGGVDAGFIAASQWQLSSRSGCAWEIPANYHLPIEQRVVILKNSNNKDLAQSFLEFLLSADIQAKIESAGYLQGEIQ